MTKTPGFLRRLLDKAKASTHPATPPEPQRIDTPMPVTPTISGLTRYRLEHELGRGSMGAVYLATDLQTSGKVAIKLLSLQRDFSPEDMVEVRQRFIREARAASSLKHRDILQVLDSGASGQDTWIVMEAVQSQDLSAHTCAGQLLPVVQVLRITSRLARALAYAHRQGVVHRDIKPANVLVDLASETVKLSDFGIARIADGSRTRTGLVLGTPSYMAPEQMAGRRLDGRADLYSLGAMLFQLLTGRLPFEAPTIAGLLAAVAQDPAPDVRNLRPELPESLAQVVALALEKRPELRYPDGDQMGHDLEAVAALPAVRDR